jgi:hypothetical protein
VIRIQEVEDNSDNEDDEIQEEKVVTISSHSKQEESERKNADEQQQNENDSSENDDEEQELLLSSEQQKLIFQQMNMGMTLLLFCQLQEQENRNELLMIESDARTTISHYLMLHVFLYVREKEQTLIQDHNRKLIANDLISELVEANQTMRRELKEIVDAVQMQQQQQVAAAQRGGRGGAAAASSSSGRGGGGGGGKQRILNETF